MNIPVIRWGATVERKDAGEFVSYHDYSMLHAQIETLRDDMQRRIKLGKDAADEIDRLRAKLESRTQALHAAEQRELTALAELDEVRAELTEARRLIDEARRQEPVAWAYHFSLHAYHDDFFDNEAFSDVLLKRRRELSPDDAFGRRGRDFDEKALITEVPLYAAPVPAQPAAVPAEVARAVQILRKHNEWRRGADNNHWQATPYSPAELGRAIDTVCDATHDIQHDTLNRATEYAHDLVTWLHRDHYADNTTFEPFDDLLGLLSQIDNMICGWKEPQPAVPDDGGPEVTDGHDREGFAGGCKRAGCPDGDECTANPAAQPSAVYQCPRCATSLQVDETANPSAVPDDVAKDAIPNGWVFFSADASVQANDTRRPLTAMIRRDVDGLRWWLSLTDEEKERTPLYSTGAGMTLKLALDNAVAAILSATDAEVKNAT